MPMDRPRHTRPISICMRLSILSASLPKNGLVIAIDSICREKIIPIFAALMPRAVAYIGTKVSVTPKAKYVASSAVPVDSRRRSAKTSLKDASRPPMVGFCISTCAGGSL